MRIVMKISGEALKSDSNISGSNLDKVLSEVKDIASKHELIMVCGGGNFWRGRNDFNIDSVISDQVGMLATVMNAIALQSYLNLNGVSASCYSSFEVPGIIKKDNYSDVNADLKAGKVVIFGGGLGIPNLSTDMTTVSKACEYDADLILMAKNVDAIYDRDPKLEGAKRINKLSHLELFNMSVGQGASSLMILDIEAMAKLVKYEIPMYVYNSNMVSNLDDVLLGKVGTRVIAE